MYAKTTISHTNMISLMISLLVFFTFAFLLTFPGLSSAAPPDIDPVANPCFESGDKQFLNWNFTNDYAILQKSYGSFLVHDIALGFGIAPTTTSLSQVKVPVLYERLNDSRPKRPFVEQVQILKDTNADLVFRASWRWYPQPNNCSQPPDELKKICNESGYSFEQMKNVIQEIKKENPNIIIIGGVPAQKINKKIELNEITGETFNETQTWAMALDTAKWGISSPTKDELQVSLQKTYGVDGYYPDITNPQFQELLLSWAERQIDSGMDGIWIDLLYAQADILRIITKDVNHTAVNESFDAATKVVDEIHTYGESKGKYIYVGTWPFYGYPYAPPKLDFVTSTPTAKEVYYKKLDEIAWNAKKDNVEKTFGNIPFFAFIDWNNDNTSLSTFSQHLNKTEQGEFLKIADDFFTSNGIKFIYPVHGGNMGSNATILAYGKYKWYDSLAPEFQTYDTIKQLAQNKSTI